MTHLAAVLPPHLSGTAVSAAADSELSAPERARVLSHLSRCAACRARLVTEMATKDLVHSLGLGPSLPPPAGLSRDLLGLEHQSAAAAGPPADLAADAPPSRPSSRGQRSVPVGLLGAVGLAVAAVVPVASVAAPLPARTASSQPPAVSGSVRGATGVRQPTSAAASLVLPAVFSTDDAPVAAVRGTTPTDARRATAATREVERAALVAVLSVLVDGLGTPRGH